MAGDDMRRGFTLRASTEAIRPIERYGLSTLEAGVLVLEMCIRGNTFGAQVSIYRSAPCEQIENGCSICTPTEVATTQ